MTEKHPLEIAIETIIAALPTRGAIKANVKADAIAALDKWRERPEPVQSTELSDLRAMNAAVQKALKWAPPEHAYYAEAISSYVGQTLQPAPLPPGVVRAQSVPISTPGAIAAVVANGPVLGGGPRLVKAASRVVSNGGGQ